MSTILTNKIDHLLHLMKLLSQGREIYPQDESLHAEMQLEGSYEARERKLRRYLDDIVRHFGHIVTVEKRHTLIGGRKVSVYRVIDKERDISEVFRFFLENASDLTWLLQLVHENDPSLLNDYEQDPRASLEKSLSEDRGIFLFVGNPFENLDDPRLKSFFTILRKAVKNREYRDIVYNYRKREEFKNLKCIRLIYMSGNWYLAAEGEKDRKLCFLRLAFMESIRNSRGKATYNPDAAKRHLGFLAHIQNPMTLEKEPETAVLRTSPRVAMYFREGMKPFFPSQKYIDTAEDGGIVFSVKFTQPLEILPFVKHWQPDITIVSPSHLKDELISDLKRSIENHIR